MPYRLPQIGVLTSIPIPTSTRSYIGTSKLYLTHVEVAVELHIHIEEDNA